MQIGPSITLMLLLFGSFQSVSTAVPAEPNKQGEPIQLAIKKGSDYLIGYYKADGPVSFGTGEHQSGKAAVAGLALLESGVDDQNPSLQTILKAVHATCLQQTSTYDVSLCIMFLDRLGRTGDSPFIQYLGVRLLGGQSYLGGWNYTCGTALLPQEESRLRAALSKESQLTSGPRPEGTKEPKKNQSRPDLPDTTNPRKESPKDPSPEEPSIGRPVLHPEVGRILNAIRDPRNQPAAADPITAIDTDDNSNTQFAILGLWCARKHGVPIEKAMQLSQKRFRGSQGENGGWGYRSPNRQVGVMNLQLGATPQMTCAGLIGIAASYGATETILKSRPDPNRPTPRKNNQPEPGQDQAVKAGFRFLAISLVPVPIPDPKLPMPNPGLNGPMGGGDLRQNLYLLWCLERLCVIYGIDNIGNLDWYSWGADYLTRNQLADGTWKWDFMGTSPDVNTSLALLFLNRANVAKDLTAILAGKMGTSVLKSGGSGKKDPTNPGSSTARPATDQTKPDSEFEAQVSRLTDAVMAASGEQQVELLNMLRDTKGSAYTEALARVAAKLTGNSQLKAREGLARRLTRMTAATLRDMLADSNLEIRRAAATACGLKEDKLFVADLIGLITDKEMAIVQAARASLMKLTGKDFGPESSANDADTILRGLGLAQLVENPKIIGKTAIDPFCPSGL